MKATRSVQVGCGLALLLTMACAGANGNGAALQAKSAANEAPPPSAERQLLEAGAVVTRPLDFQRGDAHYVGGIASGLVPATPERVMSALNDADALSAMLPLTKRVS